MIGRGDGHTFSRSECTYCGRIHPRGKRQKAKARKLGWKSCRSVAIERGHKLRSRAASWDTKQ